MAETITLYGFWRSLAAYRVRIALQMKGLPYREIPVDILTGEQHGADYGAVNPEHVVPTLVHDGRTLFQSQAILEYLDETFPDPPLMPTDAAERAYVRAVALVSVADAHPLVVPRMRKRLATQFGADPAAVEAWGTHWMREGLATYETIFTRRPPAPFVAGETPTIADICFASHMAASSLAGFTREFPLCARLAETCMAVPAFAAAHPMKVPGAPA